jgi:hypothetical protein
MTVSKVLLSAVVALALVPAVAQAASNSAPTSVSPAAQSLSLSTPVRVGAKADKKSHILGLGVLGTVLIAAGAIAAGVVIADAVDNGSSG